MAIQRQRKIQGTQTLAKEDVFSLIDLEWGSISNGDRSRIGVLDLALAKPKPEMANDDAVVPALGRVCLESFRRIKVTRQILPIPTVARQ